MNKHKILHPLEKDIYTIADRDVQSSKVESQPSSVIKAAVAKQSSPTPAPEHKKTKD